VVGETSFAFVTGMECDEADDDAWRVYGKGWS